MEYLYKIGLPYRGNIASNAAIYDEPYTTFDSATETGWYTFGALGTPPADEDKFPGEVALYGMLIVLKGIKNTYIKQIAFTTSSETMYVRGFSGHPAVWNAWYKFTGELASSSSGSVGDK